MDIHHISLIIKLQKLVVLEQCSNSYKHLVIVGTGVIGSLGSIQAHSILFFQKHQTK
jgi:hypothetical protein